ncbi:P-loop containing nucleoside triphosphate hydrolase protein [Desarmillaria tabescens]|uniref:P-loop containing nucleoside triphosphate hydrolase protein n=1 Tax=Armillaria tabescens TaxID=1929756 RepID=A0AA39MP43_ARMTA|nr:P-loop containing nucleoside triphosphate hydrolase protein [Desarmillaria tabescens]KAK0440869.1 P-loop containing nucleoside triphosphate hydrolase protein [Desarmillaria tabescens]
MSLPHIPRWIDITVLGARRYSASPFLSVSESFLNRPPPDCMSIDKANLTMNQVEDERRELETFQLGVWKVSILKSTSFNFRKQFSDVKVALKYFWRLTIEVYTLAPVLATLYVLNELWSGVQGTLLLYLSSQILRIIEIGMVDRTLDIAAVLKVLVVRILCVIFSAVLQWARELVLPTLKTRITTHFELFLMQARLRIDLPTSQEPRSKLQASSYDAWTSFEGILELATNVSKALSQLILVVQASRSTGSPLFATLCIIKPVFLTITGRTLWDTPHIVHTDNEHRQRMKTLNSMSSPEYRSEVLGGDIANYIINEYKKATQLLGGLSDEWAPYQYMVRTSPVWQIINDILGDLPTIYCVVVYILHSEGLSLSSFAILQESSQTLDWAIQYVVMNGRSFWKQYQELKNVYESANIANTLSDGDIAYPSTASEEKPKGMSFELRDVSFSYPGSQCTKPTLSNINLTIKPGQLVVIVGSNGSGKSTILKLLSRFYDPTSSSDSILVDGIPVSHYRMADLRRATATLTQEHSLFPLSLGENIGLGYAGRVDDADMIDRSAEMGGASHCLEKLELGKKTRLRTENEARGCNLPDDPDHPLQVELAKLRKNIQLSGGEVQRIVAARTFMRFESGEVRFVAVDEPSSALDSEGEFALFDNLIQAREGKTMIFVTHRFGNLTKRADLVVCMKDGTIVETGTHEQLMVMEGEYAKLYNIQAKAFVDTESSLMSL